MEFSTAFTFSACRTRQKKRATHEEKTRELLSYIRKENINRMRGAYTTDADIVSVPWTFAEAKSLVIMDCPLLFLDLLDDLSVADCDRTAGGESRPRAVASADHLAP